MPGTPVSVAPRQGRSLRTCDPPAVPRRYAGHEQDVVFLCKECSLPNPDPRDMSEAVSVDMVPQPGDSAGSVGPAAVLATSENSPRHKLKSEL